MRLILSRKGFDSANGKIPNPIMPDGTLLSFPIPSDNGEEDTYRDLGYKDKSYYEILSELNPRIAEMYNTCHVDPAISNCYIKNQREWKPAFGQYGISEKLLEKYNIDKGDIFLFYGWFRKTKFDEKGRLRFLTTEEDKTLDKHIIFGYMEIGEKITNLERIRNEFAGHPHSIEAYSVNNALYLPEERLTLDKTKKGYGLLKFDNIRQLTKEGHKRSEWELPDCFDNVEFTYHSGMNYGWTDKKDCFKAAYRGQEFITKKDISEEVKQWILRIISQ